jgi:hypothetical protein
MNEYAGKSRIALGLFAICLVFLLEAFVAHRTAPNPASRFVWAGLGLAAVACLVYGVWAHRRSKPL